MRDAGFDRSTMAALTSPLRREWPAGADLGERVRRACVLVGLAVMPAAAEAQVGFSLEPLARRVRPGDRVAVTLRVETEAGRLPCRQGRELQGRLAGLSSTTLPLRTKFSRLELAEREVCLVRRRHRDPCWNGAVIGTLAAGGFVAWYAEGNDEGAGLQHRPQRASGPAGCAGTPRVGDDAPILAGQAGRVFAWTPT